MATTTQQFTNTLNVTACCTCDMAFGMTPSFEQRRRDDHAEFYCPAGHPQGFYAKNEVERLKQRLRVTEESERFYRDQAATARRSASAQRGQVTRLRNLVAKGICPVAGCRRNFTNVREHMTTEHPDFHKHETTA